METQSALRLWMVCLMIIAFVKDVDLEVPRPRGVPVEKASLYGSGVDFACFDGSAVIPFDQVNDDYCDCPDGSDEPGTSACSAGTFHCINAGHSPLDIPSSRVNDGICDCCDGSDEYESPVACANTCMELGREAREEAERKAKLSTEGHQIFLLYSKQGQDAKQENQVRIEALQTEKEELEVIKEELEAKKIEAETPEKEAKDRHQQVYDEEKTQRESSKEEVRIVNAFSDLDHNQNSELTVAEMQLRQEFDIDANGEVSEDEAREHLEDHDTADMDLFRSTIWPNVKEIYLPPIAPPSPDEDEDEGPPPPVRDTLPPMEEQEEVGEDYYGEDEYGEDDDDEEEHIDDLEDDDFHDDYEEQKGDDGNDSSDDIPMPSYDEETLALIEVADAAREAFRDADTKLEDLKREERELQSMLDLDLGDAVQFYPLKGMCYEYTEREYVYKLCPFERATQRQKVGGGPETSLGLWGKWDGSVEAPYSAMLYEKGQSCWNGPDRSVKVLLECGVSHELYSASEPNRCEYQFEFRSPAACNKAELSPTPADIHQEL